MEQTKPKKKESASDAIEILLNSPETRRRISEMMFQVSEGPNVYRITKKHNLVMLVLKNADTEEIGEMHGDCMDITGEVDQDSDLEPMNEAQEVPEQAVAGTARPCHLHLCDNTKN